MERLGQLRTEHYYSQREMAEILGIPLVSYNRYENGKRLIPVDVLIRFCDHFDVSLDYVVGRTDKYNL